MDATEYGSMMRPSKQGHRRAFYATPLVFSFLVLIAVPAGAALVLDFTPAEGPPGIAVEATSRGAVFADVPEDSYDLYLAPSERVAGLVTGAGRPHHPSLVGIGKLEADPTGVGRLRFTVPEVEPGRYVVIAHCKTCQGDGTTFSAIGPFRVTSGPSLPETGGLPFVVWFAGALCGLGAILLATTSHSTR